MRRTLTLFATLFVLSALVAQLNHVLADARVYLFVGSLFVAFAALTQPLGAGLAATVLAGLLCDATEPLWFDLAMNGGWSLKNAALLGLAHAHTVLFIIAHIAVFNVRDRFPRDDTIGRIVVALLANLGLFLAFSFMHIVHSPVPGAVWPRLIADLVCSQVFLTLIAPWFFALQTQALVLARVERETLG